MRHVEHTDNDEAIARAIAEIDDHSYMTVHPSAPPQSTAFANCPGHHGLQLYETSAAQRVTCNQCRKSLTSGESVWSCATCNFDTCDQCYRRGTSYRPITVQGTSLPTASSASDQPSNSSYPQASQFNSPPLTRSNPFATHMCLIPCTIGNITVEMLVDTGAQTSVLSMPLVRQLGLSLDRSLMGVAAGVGRARICGRVTNVVCSLGTGHVEFLMDFIVLDVSDQLVIIGLDQLRKYKCLVDMERELLIFGGAGGVEVQMLPAEHQHFDARSWNNSGCILM